MASPLSVGFRVTGTEQTARHLRALGVKLARGPVRDGVGEAVRLVNRAAKAVVPVETGALKKALGHKTGAFKNNLGYWGLVGARKDAKELVTRRRFAFYAVRRSSWSRRPRAVVPAKYLHLVIGGTAPHAVGAGSSLRKGIQHGLRHPGAKANPFLPAAARTTEGAAREAVLRRLRRAVRDRYGVWRL
jgi:hypothetical protein